jgi:hypothetical protein
MKNVKNECLTLVGPDSECPPFGMATDPDYLRRPLTTGLDFFNVPVYF